MGIMQDAITLYRVTKKSLLFILIARGQAATSNEETRKACRKSYYICFNL
jgi:hypothetical protein